MAEIEFAAHTLYVWTPFLAGGFLWNIVISFVALAVGLACGYPLALMLSSRRRMLRRLGRSLTGASRNIPTFVFQYYLVFMLPDAVSLRLTNAAVPFPAWLKASLALALAVASFTADNLFHAPNDPSSGSDPTLVRFAPHLARYFVVIVMASSGASVIGVPELVSRCNTVIAAIGRTDAMLWIYLYAMSWFSLFSTIVCTTSASLLRSLSDR